MEHLQLLFIQMNNMLLVGEIGTPDHDDEGSLIIVGPRACQMDPKNGVMNLVPLVGNPNFIMINGETHLFSYLNEDETLTKFYALEVKGGKSEAGPKLVPETH